MLGRQNKPSESSIVREETPCSYTIKREKQNNSIEITITSGPLQGKQTQFIEVSPSFAYFNSKS